MELDMKELGRRIREAREARGLTQTQLAPILGYASNTLSQWEKGKRQASLPTLLRISQATGKPLAYFLGVDIAGGGATPELLRELKRRIDEIAAQSVRPELPGLLGEALDAFRALTDEQQRDALRYMRFLMGQPH